LVEKLEDMHSINGNKIIKNLSQKSGSFPILKQNLNLNLDAGSFPHKFKTDSHNINRANSSLNPSVKNQIKTSTSNEASINSCIIFQININETRDLVVLQKL
jgi:hypothetical protein